MNSSSQVAGEIKNVAEICSHEFFDICFVKPSAGPETSIFGFAEFGTALALLVIIYTIADVRYRFRIKVAPIPLFLLTFILAIIGFASLLKLMQVGRRSRRSPSATRLRVTLSYRPAQRTGA